MRSSMTSGPNPAGQKQFVIGRFPGFAATSWIFLLYLYIPIFLLIIFSFNASHSATIWHGFSLEWYLKAFGNDDVQRAAVNSLIVAFSATVVATVVAVFAALIPVSYTHLRAHET